MDPRHPLTTPPGNRTWSEQQRQTQLQNLRLALAATRYHQALRVTGVAPPIRPSLVARQDGPLARAPRPTPLTRPVRRPHPLAGGVGRPSLVARQDGHLAYEAQAGQRARQQYEAALTNARTQRLLLARQLAAKREYLYQDTRPKDVRERMNRDYAYQVAYAKALAELDPTFAPLIAYDPVFRSVAQGGLLVMSGVGLGAAAAAAPSGLRWLGTGLEYSTGVRASYSALRTAPGAFVRAAIPRLVLDASGQYGANVLLGHGYIGSLGEINALETGMSALGLNSYFIPIATGAASLSWNNGYQAVWRSEASGHRISLSKFAAQAGVGLAVGHFGGKLEERLLANNYRAWRSYNISLLLRTPTWAEGSLFAGLRFGQHYGPPLLFGLVEETGEGYFGDKADDWEKARNAVPPHVDSPVFLDNATAYPKTP